MRPIKLTVAGMRSYRAQRTLDFTNRTLMAILGDTGSGKSSLLEALYGALYGGSTWDARGLGALIADGVQTLQIQLEFNARGNIYTVARSISRKNYPPSKHVFDGPGGEHLDGEKDVNRRVVELVGLTGPEFLRVVILPQGRFGQLLQGTSGERTPILRGILGLGVLDRVRSVADRKADTLGAALEPILAARARLYPDPQAVADRAEAASNQQADDIRRLDAAAATLQELHTHTFGVSAARQALVTALEPAAITDLGPVLSALAAADDADAEITARDDDLAAQIVELENQDNELRAKAADATAAGITHSSLARMSEALTSVGARLTALARQTTHNAQEQARQFSEQTELDLKAENVKASAATAKAYQLVLNGLSTRAETAREQVRQRSQWIDAIRLALSEVTAHSEQLTVAVDAALGAAQALHRIRSETAGASAALSSATSELAALRDANAAAHVARQHVPGQPCPVCYQTLPAGFTPPEIRGEQDLLWRLAAAEERHDKARAEERLLERSVNAEQQKLVTLAGTACKAADTAIRLLNREYASGVSDATRIAAMVESAVERVVDLPSDQAPTPEQLTRDAAGLAGSLRLLTGLDDANKLASTRAARPTIDEAEALRTDAEQALQAGQERAQQLMSAAVRDEAEYRAAVDASHRRRSAHEAAVARTAEDSTNLAEFILGLPALVSKPLVTALNITKTSPEAVRLSAQAIPVDLLSDLQGQLSGRQDQLERLDQQRDAVMTSLRDLENLRARLRDARDEAVDRPRASARRSLERASGTLQSLTDGLAPLHEAWKALSRATEVQPPPTLTSAVIPSVDIRKAMDDLVDQELGAEVAALQARLATEVSLVRRVVAAAQDSLDIADVKTQELLTTAGASTRDELTEQLSRLKHERRDSVALYGRATAQIPVAEGLDTGVAELTFQLKVLRQVKELLSPSAFPQFVVQQRQVALLKIASSLLGQLTRAGYGFGEDFMIVDRRTGQPRHPKTLSGGESFLASLALALALVEISNRSGGQLDCLFLDEGFGSLDSSILGEALDILRVQATGGRLVGVISHLHAVAAEIDDVLVVTKEVGGSSFRWLDPQERDEYLLDEAAAGLLS